MKTKRFSKTNLIVELLEFSDNIAKAAKIRLDHGYSVCVPKRESLMLKQAENNTYTYRLTDKELNALIQKAVEYGRAKATQDLATWIDEGRFGVTGTKDVV